MLPIPSAPSSPARSFFLDTPPTIPPDVPEEEPRRRPPDRFPSIVLAGPGCLCLLFVLFMTRQHGAGILFGLLAALIASFFFGVIGARARTDNTRSVGVILAFLGPVIWCLLLMGNL